MNIHPTQKPIELFMRPIEYHTDIGDICYEPFLGSGTTCVAAIREGRRSLGVELDHSYVAIAEARCHAEVAKYAERLPLEVTV